MIPQEHVEYVSEFLVNACGDRGLAFACVLVGEGGEVTLVSNNPNEGDIRDLLRFVANSKTAERSITLVSRPQ